MTATAIRACRDWAPTKASILPPSPISAISWAICSALAICLAAGRRGGRARAQRGEDLRYDLEMSLEDAIRGLSVEIQVPRMDVCSRCQGTGAEKVRWLGDLPHVPRARRGDLSAELPADSPHLRQCGGRGQIVRRPCTQCRGERQVRTERKLKVTIPAGVDTGTHLKLAQEGQSGLQRRSRGRSVRRHQGQGASDLRAAGRRSALHRSHQRGAGRAGNRRSTC